MLYRALDLHIRTSSGVWIFACIVTFITMIISNRLVWLFFPAEIYVFTAWRAALITLFITMPVCLFIGIKIRENTQLGDELVRVVNRDRLTDVATRDFFFDRMNQSPEAYGVVLMIDIDHFKRVNDTYGHLAGDQVIRHVSKTLQKECRTDDIVCRFGGEEFVVFLQNADEDTGVAIAERIRLMVEKAPATHEGVVVSVTVSIGGSLKEGLQDVNLSIQLADEALYLAKNGGRNQLVVNWLTVSAESGSSVKVA